MLCFFLLIGFFVIYFANREDNPMLLIYVVSFFISASILIVKNPLLMGLQDKLNANGVPRNCLAIDVGYNVMICNSNI